MSSEAMVNSEEQMSGEIQLKCDGEDCENSVEDTRSNLVDAGWTWREGSVHGLFRITAVECQVCDVDIEEIWEDRKGQAKDVHSKPSGRDRHQTTLETRGDNQS